MGEDLNGVPAKVETAEAAFVWLIQKVLRGTWFRRAVFLLVVFAILFGPPTTSSVLSFVDVPLPAWYRPVYWVAIALLFLAVIVIGARTIPRPSSVGSAETKGRAVRGLVPFNLDDRELFEQLHRGIELQRVLAALLDPNFRIGVLQGLSGTGKTSFIRAGIQARLRDEGIPVFPVELSNEDPRRSIDRAFAAQPQPKPNGVLLLDQFEQFFLHQRTAEQRKPFIDALIEWHGRDSQLKVLISIRAEDSWRMHELQSALQYDLSVQNLFTLSKFTPEQTVDVLRVLCEPGNIEFEEASLQKIANDDLRDDDGLISPVNIGIVILALATSRSTLTAGSFKTYRGIEGLLGTWLDSQMEAATAQGIDRAVVLTLTALCDFELDRRAGILDVSAIMTRLGGDLTRAQVESALRWLTGSNVRLVVRVGKEEPGYQLSHERLIAPVRKLAGRILDDASRASELLDRRARAWLANMRSSRFLLTAIEYWRIERQRRYLAWGDSRTEKESLLQKSRARLRWRAALAATTVLLVIIAYGAWQTNRVQRWYVSRELHTLSKSYATAGVVRALGALGDLESARAAAATESARRSYGEEEDEPRAIADAAVEAAKTALARRDEILLKQSLETVDALEADFRLEPKKEIAIAMLRTASLRNDPQLRARSLSLMKSVSESDDGSADQYAAQLSMSTALAEVGLFDEARAIAMKADGVTTDSARASVAIESVRFALRDKEKNDAMIRKARDLAETLHGDTKPLTLLNIAFELTKSGRFDDAVRLAETLGNYRAICLLNIERASATRAVLHKDRNLLVRARQLAENLDAGYRASELKNIAVRTAELGRALHDRKLLEDAEKLRDSLTWSPSETGPWKIAVIAGDNARAGQLYGSLYSELAAPQAGSISDDILDMPNEIHEVAYRLGDQALLSEAREIAANIDPYYHFKVLFAFAKRARAAGDIAHAKEYLELAWADADWPQTQDVFEEMARTGSLKRAREMAEEGSIHSRAPRLAAVVLADMEGFRTSAHP
jgi:tetratricopeptide (TPR) repeat protein